MSAPPSPHEREENENDNENDAQTIEASGGDVDGDDATGDADVDADVDNGEEEDQPADEEEGENGDENNDDPSQPETASQPTSQPETSREEQDDAPLDSSRDPPNTNVIDDSHNNKHEEEEEKQSDEIDSVLRQQPIKVQASVATEMQPSDATDVDVDGDVDVSDGVDAGGQTGLDGSNGGGGEGEGEGDVGELAIEVTILPDGFRHLELFRLDETIGSIKVLLGERFKLDSNLIRLQLGDLILEDERTLYEYREFDVSRMVQAGLTHEEIQTTPLSLTLEIHLNDDDANGVGGGVGGEPREEYKMPDIIKVVINREELEAEAEEEEEKELNGQERINERTPEQVVYVQVIRDNLHHPKPFLGGFRHKYYGTIYHHSSTQTARKKKKVEVVKFHRETQTIQIISRSQQTNREAGTQMERRDLLQDSSNDVVIMSKPYFTADELEALRDEKAREVQCFLRQCFAWRRVRRLRESKAEKLEADIKARALEAKVEAENHARQIERRMHPRTKEDFDVLFSELEAWRLHETQRIKTSGLSSEEVASALQDLLNKEVKLLQTIDRLKITAAKENKWSRTQSSLEKMASPKEWSSSEGDLIEVETPFTIRAKELVDLYNGLCLRNLSRAQRVDVLLHIKYTVKEFDCELSREIVELIKREEDLLRRQRSEQSLEGCRKRLQNLFLHFVNTPTFNPEASNFQRVPSDGGFQQPLHALSSSLAKPSMLTRTNTITVASNVAGRIFANKNK